MQEVFEKIIEKLKSEVKRWEDSGTEYEDKCEIAVGRGLRNAIEIVKQEAEKFCTDTNVGSNGWIPCSSGVLPKRSNSYCVTKMCENDGNPIYETCHEIFWTNDNKWDCERDEDCEWRVIAWKEKDKPYQPKGE